MGIRDNYSYHLRRLVAGAIGINYGSYGIALPLKVARVLGIYHNPSILALGIVIGVLVFVYIYRSCRGYDPGDSSERSYFKLMALGIIVFALGYAIFLTNSQVEFTTTGAGNRTAIAATLGVAISFVGVIGWMSWVLPSTRLRQSVFCLLISLLSVSGFLISNTIASFWVDAAGKQQDVIDAVRKEFPNLEPGSTLIIDGLCPYSGPGIVFECYWDVGGMLKTYYQDTSLNGDIVTAKMKIEDIGLYTSIYAEKRFYPYNSKLILFNIEQNRIYRLGDPESARHYFQVINPEYQGRCPQGSEGQGVQIF